MSECTHEGKCFGACGKQVAPSKAVAGDKVVSRLTGKTVTIGAGPLCGGKVMKNDPVAGIK